LQDCRVWASIYLSRNGADSFEVDISNELVESSDKKKSGTTIGTVECSNVVFAAKDRFGNLRR